MDISVMKENGWEVDEEKLIQKLKEYYFKNLREFTQQEIFIKNQRIEMIRKCRELSGMPFLDALHFIYSVEGAIKRKLLES